MNTVYTGGSKVKIELLTSRNIKHAAKNSAKKSLFWGGRVEQLARALKIQSLKSIRMQMQEKF